MLTYLGLYEKSGVMARPWADAGYRCICVDLNAEPGERDGIEFVRADLADWIPPQAQYAFCAAFPPCTHLAGSGARWWEEKGFDPCDFGGYLDPPGDAYTKRTCLWVGGGFVMPKPKPVFPIEGSRMHTLPPSDDRSDLRSVTPAGFAQAVFEANAEAQHA